jgi:DNA invertase Pin-like site-specific DNA recombinase
MGRSSGARTDRAELGKILKRLERDDLLIVTRLDRLARSTRDLLNILHAIADRGAKFKSLHDPWCDTSTPQGELLVTVLAGFATFERHLIKARTDDGRKRAQARGVRFGRPRKMTQHQRQEAIDRLANGETLVDVARTFGVDPTTIGRLQQ